MSASPQASAPTMRSLQEWAQPVLMLFCLLLAYQLPFEGLFLSYAILGPLHYLTQISWLHDRSYFLKDTRPRRFFVVLAVILTIWLALPYEISPLPIPSNYAIAFIALSLLVLPAFLNMSGRRNLQLALVCSVPVIVWAFLHVDFFIIVGSILLTTFIHVAVFTFTFLLLGARSGNPAGIVSACAWLLCALVVFLYPPTVHFYMPDWFDLQRPLFDPVALALGGDAQNTLDRSWAAAYGLLTFAFTYHYLNWFSKTELLKWHKIPLKRGLSIAVLYVAAVGFYLYNYLLGFRVILFLGAMHVFLEFPLNVQTIRSLLSRKAPAAAPPAPKL